MFKRQTVQMLWVKDVSKTNSTNVVCKNMFKRQTVQMLWVKHVKRQTIQMLE